MKAELFDELTQSIREGGAILREETPASRSFELAPSAAPFDVARIREAQKMSQSEFAAILGVTTVTVRRWEKSGRVPNGPARVLLRIAEKHPQLLREPLPKSSLRRSKIARAKPLLTR